jgi:hypothetical protein
LDESKPTRYYESFDYENYEESMKYQRLARRMGTKVKAILRPFNMSIAFHSVRRNSRLVYLIASMRRTRI